LADFLPQRQSAEIADRIRRLYAGETLGPVEIVDTKPNGDRVMLEMRSVLTEYQGEDVVLVVGRDITERKRAEVLLQEAHDQLDARVRERTEALARANEALRTEAKERGRVDAALRDSERRYRTLVELSPDAILVVGPEGRLEVYNARAAELLGLNGSENLAVLRAGELLQLEDERLIGRARPYLQQHGRVRDVALRVTRRDGTSIPAEGSASLLPPSDGGGARALIVLRDVTTRRLMESAVRRRNAELQALNVIAMKASQAGPIQGLLRVALRQVVVLTDAALAWVELNALTAEPMTYLGDGSAELQLSARPLIAAISEKVLATGKSAYADRAHPDAVDVTPGATLPVAIGVPIASQHNTIGVMGLLFSPRQRTPADPGPSTERWSRDASFLRTVAHQLGTAAENAALAETAAEVKLLREIDELRSELIANFSHDLKTPLGVIKFASTTLLRDDVTFDHATQQELLLSVDQQTDRLRQTVDRILALGQLENGDLQVHAEPTDLLPLIEDLADAMQRHLSNHKLRVACEQEQLPAMADPHLIRNVLTNLVDNAIKYSPQGGAVVVSGSVEADRVVIGVEDQGIGIAEAERGRIFERYYRSSDPVVQRTAGVGLGLPICRGIVEAHGGAIWAESGSGRGAVILFTLPASSEIDGPAAHEPPGVG
jgi:PAS domain S-box-containing protein